MRTLGFALLFVLLLAAPASAALLNWTDTSNNELGFEVERKPGLCPAPGTWGKVGESPKDVPTFLDATTGPNTGLAWSYRVRAFNNTMLDGSGVRLLSGFSNCADIAYPLTTAPADPSQLVVTPGQ